MFALGGKKTNKHKNNNIKASLKPARRNVEETQDVE